MTLGSIPPTERLHLERSDLLVFEAKVLAATGNAGRDEVALDRTAFYVESGGQPSDQGTLAGRAVVGLRLEDNVVWHELGPGPFLSPGDPVSGAVDSRIRNDHMQQHTGQHILSQAFVRAGGGATRGFHLGREESTIDLNGPRPEEDLVAAAVLSANRCVLADVPVRVHFAKRSELNRYPLRREPGVDFDTLRLIEIEDFDWSACGGTHAGRTGEVGPLHVLGVDRIRDLWRIHFLAGWRALRYLAGLQGMLDGLARDHSLRWDGIKAALQARERENLELSRELRRLRVERGEAEAARLWESCSRKGEGPSRIARWCGQASADELRALAGRLVSFGPVLALVGGNDGGRSTWIAARSERMPEGSFEAGWAAGSFLRAWLAAFGGKGGGSEVFAQGTGPAVEDSALEGLEGRMAGWAAGEP